MTLTQLEYFCMVCRYHSITRAADALYVSQPTISTSIRDLEKEFHLKLFNHGKNRISLTKDGEAFYQKAEYILRQTQELYSDFSNIEENRHPLRIGIPPMFPKGYGSVSGTVQYSDPASGIWFYPRPHSGR